MLPECVLGRPRRTREPCAHAEVRTIFEKADAHAADPTLEAGQVLSGIGGVELENTFRPKIPVLDPETRTDGPGLSWDSIFRPNQTRRTPSGLVRATFRHLGARRPTPLGCKAVALTTGLRPELPRKLGRPCSEEPPQFQGGPIENTTARWYFLSGGIFYNLPA